MDMPVQPLHSLRIEAVCEQAIFILEGRTSDHGFFGNGGGGHEVRREALCIRLRRPPCLQLRGTRERHGDDGDGKADPRARNREASRDRGPRSSLLPSSTVRPSVRPGANHSSLAITSRSIAKKNTTPVIQPPSRSVPPKSQCPPRPLSGHAPCKEKVSAAHANGAEIRTAMAQRGIGNLPRSRRRVTAAPKTAPTTSPTLATMRPQRERPLGHLSRPLGMRLPHHQSREERDCDRRRGSPGDQRASCREGDQDRGDHPQRHAPQRA